ncbi:MAG: DUF4430 domain-containing protein [Intestinibacter sp.]|uniref:DUF4430 domain-containing protein n=1 Tax=Intestinibacter sp. TaxID=1965304 RepID=UPI0025C19B0D|nr:DUF4430 domain-containing protein [Intestinibacter sp.]MCI6737283.1 DUF4430 domain-containing protein [Intestinibacter sp.]
MKKITRKIISLVMCFLLAISVVGCSSVTVKEDTKSSTDNSTIPENGIVSEEVFKELKDSGDMKLFNGENKEFTYQWMFMGTDISSPRDLNLKVESASTDTDLVKKESKSDKVYGFKFAEDTSLDSKTALSIIYKDDLGCTAADIYQVENNKLKKITSATVETSEGTTFNFSIKDRAGEFYIVGSDPKQAAIDADDDSSSSTSSSKREQLAEKSEKVKQQLGIYTSTGTPNKDGKDKYLTDPTPAGKPKPVEWNEKGNEVDKSKVGGYCTLSITCKTLLKPENKKVAISNGKEDMIPSDGVIYKTKKVKFYKNESVFDVLLRETKANKIHMEYVMTPAYNSNYIEGIHNLYEFDGGELSGWMYSVNGWFPNYGCSRYKLKDGDSIKWVYTCDLGRDVGDNSMSK